MKFILSLIIKKIDIFTVLSHKSFHEFSIIRELSLFNVNSIPSSNGYSRKNCISCGFIETKSYFFKPSKVSKTISLVLLVLIWCLVSKLKWPNMRFQYCFIETILVSKLDFGPKCYKNEVLNRNHVFFLWPGFIFFLWCQWFHGYFWQEKSTPWDVSWNLKKK